MVTIGVTGGAAHLFTYGCCGGYSVPRVFSSGDVCTDIASGLLSLIDSVVVCVRLVSVVLLVTTVELSSLGGVYLHE